MRYLIFTDIHGNFEAFQAVLKAVQKKRIDHYIFLGDLVGYGASPNEVIARILTLKPLSIVRGNHDKAVSGLDSVQTFNPIAASAIFWTKKAIARKHLDFLARLKQSPEVVQGSITICHGAPFDEDYYIFGEFDASEAFRYIQTQVCFFGHTHFPYVYVEKDGSVEGTFLEGDASEVRLEKGVRYLVNPGSVGQPRDRDPRSAYAIYDSGARTIKFYRVEYDIEETKRKILAEKLPPALAERLSLGI
ncbi:MAG TPA: metallophosphoesterase family protein [Candidatus Aminicenantes bacterium]|nr:metallophosphoesterase family protein [Candidatus Aminicenantes bacterium]